MRENLGNGQYRLDRVCSKSGYTTSTIKPAYDIYGISEAETKTTPKKKSVTWSKDLLNQEDSRANTGFPRPGHNEPAAEQSTPTAELQRNCDAPTQRKTRPTFTPKRPLYLAPGRAAD